MTRCDALAGLSEEAAAVAGATYTCLERFLTTPSDVLAAWRQLGDAADGDQAHHRGSADAPAVLLRHVASHIAPPLTDGRLLLAALRHRLRLLPTGCEPLDEMLRGGLREGQITELAGESATGKTQVCHLATLTTAQRGDRVLYIDATNSFCASRLASLHAATHLAATQLDPQQPLADASAGGGAAARAAFEAALSCVAVVRTHDVYELLQHLDALAADAAAGLQAPHLVIVDSVSALIAPVLGGAHGSGQGHALMAAVARSLKNLAETLSLAVLVTNHMVGGGSRRLEGDPSAAGPGAGLAPAGNRPALGEGWRNQPHVRVQLSMPPEGSAASGAAYNGGDADGSVRIATLTASTLLPTGVTARFRLTERGAEAAP